MLLKLWRGHHFNSLIITKRQDSVNTAHGITALILHILSDHGLFLYQVSSKYLKQFKSYGADMISILNIT